MGWSKPVWPFWPSPTQPGPNLTGLGLAHSLYSFPWAKTGRTGPGPACLLEIPCMGYGLMMLPVLIKIWRFGSG